MLPRLQHTVQSGGDIAEHSDGAEWDKLQGCPELYRNLLLTAESQTGLPYSPTHQPAARPGTLLRILLEADHHPVLSVKHINLCSAARKGEIILQYV